MDCKGKIGRELSMMHIACNGAGVELNATKRTGPGHRLAQAGRRQRVDSSLAEIVQRDTSLDSAPSRKAQTLSTNAL